MQQNQEIKSIREKRESHLDLARGERLLFMKHCQIAHEHPSDVHMISVDQTKPHFIPNLYPTPHVRIKNQSHSPSNIPSIFPSTSTQIPNFVGNAREEDGDQQRGHNKSLNQGDKSLRLHQ
jgi:hypothetical protein